MAVDALALVKQGVDLIGQYGPEVWAQMVTYNLVLTVAGSSR